MLLGAIVAVAIVVLMLVAARDRRADAARANPTAPVGARHRARSGQDQHCSSWSWRRSRSSSNYAPSPGALDRVCVDILFTIAFALQVAIWAQRTDPRRDRPPGRRGAGRNRRSAMRCRSSACWSASLCSRSRLIVILDNLGVNVTALIAGLGIGGIAIGLAAQGIFSDLFAALAILFDKPVPARRHDPLRQGDQADTGTVERIGLKTTRMRSRHRRAGDHGQHQAARAGAAQHRPRRGSVASGCRSALVYQTAAAKRSRAWPTSSRRGGGTDQRLQVRWSAARSAASARARSIASSSTTTAQPRSGRLARQQVGDHHRACERLSSERASPFAYPTQTTFTAAPDGTLVMPYAPPPAAGSEAKS